MLSAINEQGIVHAAGKQEPGNFLSSGMHLLAASLK